MSRIFGFLLFSTRLFLFILSSIILAIAVMPLWLLPKWKSVKALTFGTKVWSYTGAKIFGIKVKIYGNHKKVHGLIVSNHLSHVDIFLLGSIFTLRFAPKTDVAKWPILGWVFKTSRPIWVDRRSKHASINTMKEFAETVKHNINLIAFPEGTTSNGKCDLYPFKSTTFEAAMHEKISVYPILIVYENDSVPWAVEDTTPLLSHSLKVFQMFHIRAELHILDPVSPKKGESRKDFCKEVYNIMNDRYRELIALKNK